MFAFSVRMTAVLFCMGCASACAAEPIVKQQWGTIGFVSARDGYLAWSESKLDERTRDYRAQSFFHRAYRLKLDGKANPEMLTESKPTTGHYQLMLGQAGWAIWTRVNGGAATIFLTRRDADQKPATLSLNARIEEVGEFTAAGVLASVSQGVGYGKSLNFIPLVGERVDEASMHQLHEFPNTLRLPADAWLGPHHLLHRPRNAETYRLNLHSLAALQDKPLWTWQPKDKDDHLLPLGLSDKYVYGFYRNTLSRLAMETGKQQTVTLPGTVIDTTGNGSPGPRTNGYRLSDRTFWSGTRGFLILAEPKKPEAIATITNLFYIDVETLKLYPIELPQLPATEPQDVALAADPHTGAVYFTRDNAIHTRSPAKAPRPWPNPQWQP